MKNNFIKLFLIFLFTISFCIQISAQNSTKKNEIKIKEFIKSFIKALENTKDIRKVPKEFFVSDYYKRFAENEDSGDIFNDLRISSLLWKKIPLTKRLKYNSLRFNFNILPTMLIDYNKLVDKETEQKNSSKNEKDSNSFFKSILPSKVFIALKRTKILFKSFDNNKEIKTLKDFNILLTEMESVLTTLQTYLKKNKLPKQNSFFSVEIKSLIEQASWKENDSFCGKCKFSCHNLPQNTRYIYIGGFLLRLTVIQQNGKFKIFDAPVWEDASSRFPWSPC